MQQTVHARAVGQIAAHQGKRFSEGLDLAQVLFLDGGVIKAVEIIQRPDRVALAQETFTKMRTNETCPACD
jgi:hypothetical protein